LAAVLIVIGGGMLIGDGSAPRAPIAPTKTTPPAASSDAQDPASPLAKPSGFSADLIDRDANRPAAFAAAGRRHEDASATAPAAVTDDPAVAAMETAAGRPTGDPPVANGAAPRAPAAPPSETKLAPPEVRSRNVAQAPPAKPTEMPLEKLNRIERQSLSAPSAPVAAVPETPAKTPPADRRGTEPSASPPTPEPTPPAAAVPTSPAGGADRAMPAKPAEKPGQPERQATRPAPPKPAIASESGTGRFVVRAQMTSAIRDREPVDALGPKLDLGRISDNRVFFFTELRGLNGRTIEHRWQRDGRVVQSYRMPIRSDRWRAYSAKSIERGAGGTWEVLVVDADGTVIGGTSFVVE
jgi:hypothetical protein